MKIRPLVIPLLFLSVFCGAQTPSAALSPASQEKTEEIRKLLVATDAFKNVETMWDNMLPQMGATLKPIFLQGLRADRGEKPENVDAAVKFFASEFRKQLDSRQLIDRVVIPVYDARFSADEIHQLRAFYETPLGRKMVTTGPEAMKQTFTGATALGKEIAIKLQTNPAFHTQLQAILRGENPN